MRKTAPPSETWQKQLPHKVRKLEERLYRSAPSLEAYLDRQSLKERLKSVAKAITQRFNEAKMKRPSLQSSRSSVSSLSSFGNVSNRDSITSIGSLDSLQTLQRMFAEKTVLPIPVGSTSNSENTSRQQGSITQQPATSTVGDARNSQTLANGNTQQQQITDTQWQNPHDVAAFPSGMQRSHSLPLQTPAINSSQQAMSILQNPQGSFLNPNNMLPTPIVPNNNLGMLNQEGTHSNLSLFAQPMNVMMLNSANTAQMNAALNAMQLQQRQLQYALNNQQTQMMQQQQQQQSNPGMMGGNTSSGFATQQNSMPANYFMPSANANGTMPPPPRLYQGGMSSSTPASAGSTNSSGASSRKKGSGKKNKS